VRTEVRTGDEASSRAGRRAETRGAGYDYTKRAAARACRRSRARSHDGIGRDDTRDARRGWSRGSARRPRPRTWWSAAASATTAAGGDARAGDPDRLGHGADA
jgi:hypothetical protein